VSTILKALRRIEDEKAPPPGARPLREEVAAVPGEPLGRRRAGARAIGLAASALLAVLLVGGGIWMARDPGESGPEPSARAASRADPPPRSAAPAGAGAERTPPASAARPEPPAPSESSSPEPLARARPAAPPLRAAAPEHPARAPRAQAARAAAPPPAAPQEAATPREPAAAAAPPPPTPDPVPAVRHALPELTVAGTVWHPDAARRTARVELTGREEPLELREGDAVGSLVVKTIEPSGVVFRMGEVEVRRRVGE